MVSPTSQRVRSVSTCGGGKSAGCGVSAKLQSEAHCQIRLAAQVRVHWEGQRAVQGVKALSRTHPPPDSQH